MRIEPLAEHPTLIPLAAQWIYEEWSDLIPHTSLSSWQDAFKTRVKPEGIHCTFVALWEDTPVAVASLIMDDLPVRPLLNPWLAEVRVLPEYRHRGIGRSLVRRVEQEARRANVQTFYLFTPDREAFYRHMGWETMERTSYEGKEIVIMKRDCT